MNHTLTSNLTPINYQHGWYETFKPKYKEFDEFLPEYWQMKYVDRAKEIRDLNPKAIKMLDIGCGLGRAMKYFDALCFDVYGIEPSEYAFNNNPLKDKVLNNYFDKLDIKDTYDVIYIEQVLSHIPDWKGTLQKAVKLLNPNGLVVLEEPNDNNALQRIIEANKGKYWLTRDHCNYFNLEGRVLDNYLEELSLTIKKRTCTFPMEFFQLMGIEYLGSDKLGKMVHRMRFNLLKDMGDKRLELKEKLASIGIGRDLVIYAQLS